MCSIRFWRTAVLTIVIAQLAQGAILPFAAPSAVRAAVDQVHTTRPITAQRALHNRLALYPADVSSPCTIGDSHTDTFDGSRNAAWREYIPVSGPAFSLSANPGCEELTVSSTQPYDSFSYGSYQRDNAPELLRSDEGPVTSDWVALTRLTLNTANISYPDQSTSDGFHTGMVIRLSSQDRFYWGLYQTQGSGLALRLEKDNQLPAEVAQVSGTANATVTLAVHYSYAKGQCNYTFGYQFPNAPFTPLTDGNGHTVTVSDCTRDTTTTGAGAAGLGLITKTFNNGAALTTDVDWYDLITGSAVSEVLAGLNASEHATTCVYTVSPVNCATGDFYHQFNDLSIPGRGAPLHLVRTYNSLASNHAGRLGYGWTDRTAITCS